MTLSMPASVSMSRLKVYDTPAPDGQRGGTPHVHLLCTELYFVLSGQGAVEMIDVNGFSRVELQPYDALLFTPGTIHRLINFDGNLEILVVMQHSGLPERGDNIVCFTEEWLTDHAAFAEAMRVDSVKDAYQRRDRGVEGFLHLKQALADNAPSGQAALARFYELASQRAAQFYPEWSEIVRQEAADIAESASKLEALRSQNITLLFAAQHHRIAAGDPAQLGFCGHLYRYPASFPLEGLHAK